MEIKFRFGIIFLKFKIAYVFVLFLFFPILGSKNSVTNAITAKQYREPIPEERFFFPHLKKQLSI